ncbi:MAG: PIN domain-containing protein [Gemmatimonadota bacterium]
MMLVDTSVWVDHLRSGNSTLASALETVDVWCHPFVLGELACGNLRNREEILDLLAALPQAPMATHTEALALVEGRNLMGIGLGWVDVHLLGSALLAGVPLWTLDRRLAQAARRLGVGASFSM